MAERMSVLAVHSIHVARSGRSILQGISFAADKGEIVALMGPSGAGKTTVLRAIAGLEPIAQGHIDVDGVTVRAGQALRGAELRALHQRVGFVFQFHHLFANMDALGNVMLAPIHVLKQPRDEALRRSQALLASLGVDHRASAFPHQLSGGEAQRVAIARALAVNPPVLLMDEPTASLDPARRGELATTLKALAGEGRTIVMATHDEDFVRACVQRVVTLQ
jgi:ABC-type polar amino acid transport system ATPase subunit